MASTTPPDANAKRRRRQATKAIGESLRELSIQLSLLNHQVSAHVELKDADLYCLDLVNRHGPLSPSALARRAGLHPATMTGILDRLEAGGWVARQRDPNATDRRAVAVHALRDRNSELFALYSGMNTAMDDICAKYSDAELELLADFLHSATDAGQQATGQLANGWREQISWSVFDEVFAVEGIRVVLSAPQAPRMNAITERWMGSVRREPLDRILIVNANHLRKVLVEYEAHFTLIVRTGLWTRPARYAHYPIPSTPTSQSSDATDSAAPSTNTPLLRHRILLQ